MKLKLSFLMLFLITSSGLCSESIIIGVRQSPNGGYSGVTASLNVEVLKGSNHVYIDTAPLTEIDTQASARLAREVACDIASVNCSNKDFFYVIRGEFPMVGGPSAGAAMTVLTMAELLNQTVSSNVAMTGTVNPDGSVGSVGGVLEKAITASEAGVQTFLVPLGQNSDVLNYDFSNGMQVVEVSTVSEAFGYFTGVYFETPEDEVDWNEFTDFMKEMSDDLINYSSSSFHNFTTELNNSNLTKDDEEFLNGLVNTIDEQVSEMNELYSNGSYYSAASFAVSISINSLYGVNLINYGSNGEEYITALVNSLDEELNNTKSLISKEFTINHINDLEAINIAIDRFFEARELFNESMIFLYEEDYDSALYGLSFAKVRLETSKNWFGLKDVFDNNLSITFNQDMLKDLALSRVETTSNMITYAESVETSYYTETANNHLLNSMSAYDNGDYIYSIFESLKALCNANLAMQLRGVSQSYISERMELSEKQARQDINMVQSQGLTPILALSYYEYAQSFKQDNPAQALLFLEYSKQFSLLSNQMVSNIQGVSSFNNLFEVKTPDEVGEELLIVLFGVIIGLCSVFIIVYKIIL